MTVFPAYAVALTVSGAYISIAELIAGAPDSLQIVIQYGGLGAMLIWFMARVEKRMDKQVKADEQKTAALRDMAESILVSVLALRNLDSNVSDLAEKLRETIHKSR